jgi:hypothetical protein
MMATEDQSFLLTWARKIAESDRIGPVTEMMEALHRGDVQAGAEAVLAAPDSLVEGLLFRLFENPEKVTRLADAMLLAA